LEQGIVQGVAEDIESITYDKYKSNHASYVKFILPIVANLRSNFILANAVNKGQISPSKLCSMKPEVSFLFFFFVLIYTGVKIL